MFLDLGWIVNAALLVICVMWSRTVLSHLSKDMEKFKTAKNNKPRRAILIIWSITTAIIILGINFILVLVHNFRELS